MRSSSVRRPRDAVGHPHAALVEEDQARELGEPLAEPPVRRELPCDLEMGVGALDVDEVERAVADDSVRDVDVAAAPEADLRHARSVSPCVPPRIG